MTPGLSPGWEAALMRWLDQLRALDGAAVNTISAYRRDVSGFLGFLAGHLGGAAGTAALVGLGQSELRSWMAAV